MIKSVAACSVIIAVTACPVHADEAGTDPRELDRVVVTGTWLDDPLADLPNSSTVITREQIEARQDISVLDLLRATAGIQVTQYGGRGGVSSVFMRGGEPNFIVVMIDGVQVNDPNNTRGGSFDFSTLEIGEIERIEIVRGPQSAIYGSDALSGVINVITRAGEDETTVTAHAGVGDDDYWEAAGRLAGPIGDAGGYSLRVGAVDDGDPVEGSSFDSTNVTGKAEFESASGLSWIFSGRYADSDSESFPEDSGGPDLAVIRETDDRDQEDLSLGGVMRWEIAPRWVLNASANWYRHQEDTSSPGIAPGVRDGVPPTTSDSELKRTDASVNAIFDVTDRLRATAGADFRNEDGDSDGTIELGPGFELPTDFDLDRDIYGYFFEARFEATEGLFLQGSVRYDDPEDTGSETTGKLGAVYTLAGGRTRLFANWGEGFKLPSFFALGHPLVGNPDLKPEKSESWDIGIGHGFLRGAMWINLTWFDNEFDDLIDFDFELFTNVNRSEVDTEGLELEGEWNVNPSLSLRSHLTYTDIDTNEPGVTLRQRPDWRGGLSAQWRPTEAWLIDVDWLYVDETYDTSVPTGGVTLDDYQRVDVAATWDLSRAVRLIFAVDNLFDEDYEEAVGFPAPGIRPRLSARYRF